MTVIIHGAKKPDTCAECILENDILAVSKLGAGCPYTKRIIGPDEHNTEAGVIEGCPIEAADETDEQ